MDPFLEIRCWKIRASFGILVRTSFEQQAYHLSMTFPEFVLRTLGGMGFRILGFSLSCHSWDVVSHGFLIMVTFKP